MKSLFIALFTFLMILFLSISGCTSDTSSVQPTTPVVSTTHTLTLHATTLKLTTQTTPTNQLSTIEPSEMALQLSDLPTGYTIKERSERTTSDVDKLALDMGWIKGYTVKFQKIGTTSSDITLIQQDISIYPIDKISQNLPIVKTSLIKISNASYLVEPLSDPKIGDSSQVFRITISNLNMKLYLIQFVKADVYEQFEMFGTSTDYETLKNLAKIGAAKIK
jgi:hypothetical protein